MKVSDKHLEMLAEIICYPKMSSEEKEGLCIKVLECTREQSRTIIQETQTRVSTSTISELCALKDVWYEVTASELERRYDELRWMVNYCHGKKMPRGRYGERD